MDTTLIGKMKEVHFAYIPLSKQMPMQISEKKNKQEFSKIEYGFQHVNNFGCKNHRKYLLPFFLIGTPLYLKFW